jgi:folate-binding protein YgfZ
MRGSQYESGKPVNVEWKSFLAAAGATFDEHGRVRRFAEVNAEIAAAAGRDILTELSQLSLIRARGADTQNFLQGQLSNDIRLVDATHSQLSSYNTPKGRMLAILRLFKRDEDYFLQLPAMLADDILKRLRMFVLRSKLTLDNADDELLRFGVSGPAATTRLRAAGVIVPEGQDSCLTHEAVTVLSLPGPHPRFEIIAPLTRAKELWTYLAAHLQPTGPSAWRWLDIQAGIPNVFPGTVEEFVPQMANLGLVGGINFKKGCYPGQEIVARMQYLGTLKQRMYRAHVSVDTAPAPGAKLYAAGMGEQSVGMVVDAQPAPGGGHDLLAVIQIGAAASGDVRLGTAQGPQLLFQPLPYPLPDSR